MKLVIQKSGKWDIPLFIVTRNYKLARAPSDCVQYFTGTSGNVQSYNFAGGQLLQSQDYTNCIRTEEGYCSIQWKESSTTTPDPFSFGVQPTANPSPGAAWTIAAANGARPVPITATALSGAA